MGYEAYKLTAKFQNLSMDDLIGALEEYGASLIEKFCGTVTMEKVVSAGVLELVLREGGHVNTRFSPGEKVLMGIRFAKISDTRITGDVIALLKKLAARFEVIRIMDCESNRDIDLDDTAWLTKAVTYAKYDFEYYFPIRRQQARCRDIFCLCGHCYPQNVEERMSL